jgi:hypothetical protein
MNTKNVHIKMADVIVPTLLMDLPDDILMRILRANPVSEASLDFITHFKTTNSKILALTRIEMQLDKEYRDALRNLFLHRVKGTRIPCNAEHVPALPEPDNTSDVLDLFESTKSVCGKDIWVSGIFSDEYYQDLDFWEDFAPVSDESEIDVPSKRSFYLVVDFKFFAPRVQMHFDGTADLSQVPNVMRSVLLGDSDLHIAYDTYEEMDGTAFSYKRVLHIKEDNTMNDVINAVCEVEGKAEFINITVSNSGLFDSEESFAIPIPQLLAQIAEKDFLDDKDVCHVTFYWDDESD